MLKKIIDNGFDAVYKIMENSFPQNEIRSYARQRELLFNSDYALFVHEENEKIVGFISVWKLTDFIFIEHFAISNEHRGKGLGSSILTELKERYFLPLILEVEPPTDKKTRKRISFYECNGFIYHDYHYIQPAMEKGREEVELKIMSSVHLDKASFERVKKTLYSKIYHV